MYNVRAETLWYLSYGGAEKRFLFHLKFFSDFMLSLYCVLILAICIYLWVLQGKFYFSFLLLVLEREFTVGSKLYTMWTSGETDVRFRFKLKIT